ncbi:hypothetical protein QBC43DRAFT_320507 [Cladorrhinum sp. PSN259]|nr:hypothetical protein QBC43DRAFT_320507 [Cladorrhinum sp. PSN259]
MDFLGRPTIPSRAQGKTPFFSLCSPGLVPHQEEEEEEQGKWDLGPFRSYPRRMGLTRLVPYTLRPLTISTTAKDDENDEPYTGLMNPLGVPLEVQHGFYTSWLYFGLVCEFLGMNDATSSSSSGAIRLIEHDNARKILDVIYEQCVETVYNDDEPEESRTEFRYLNGQGMFGIMESVETSLGLTEEDKPTLDNIARYHHLAGCLRLASGMVDAFPEGFSPSLRLAICALGEALNLLMVESKVLRALDGSKAAGLWSAFDWKKKFLSEKSPIRQKMIGMGWCKSDLSRADATYGRLQTVYYLSLLDRRIPGRDHKGCSEERCVAGQIVDGSYKLSHDPAKKEGEECRCEELEVDLAAVNRVLADVEMETFPVLLVEEKEGGKVQLKVEAFKDGVEYVGISHVWADGLGNTKANTLQTCQISRLGRLVKAVEDDYNKKYPEQPPVKYRLWIDTLCVPVAPRAEEGPVEPERLRIYNLALGRMKDVYMGAAHVLVLDKALNSYDIDGLHPAEALLRVFASSQWMRRLWCLQEGVFARSLYFQFRDRPVHIATHMAQLEKKGQADLRCRLVAADLREEFDRLENHVLQRRPRHHDFFLAIQSTLRYRAVTVPSDEPLCIATLFGLDVAAILAAPRELEPRMQLIWQMIQSEAGSIPALVIFRADSTLSAPGWGWASNSFLLSGESNGVSGYKTVEYVDDYDQGLLAAKIPNARIVPGQGLEVRLPGILLESVPFIENGSLHAWSCLISGNGEPVVYFYNESEETWYKMLDWYASFGTAQGQPREPLTRASSDTNSGFCQIIDDAPGPIAVLRSENVPGGDGGLWLLAHPSPPLPSSSTIPTTYSPPTPVRWLRKVIIASLSQPEALVTKTLFSISQSVATSPEGQALTCSLIANMPPSTNTPDLTTSPLDDEAFQTAKRGLQSLLKEAAEKAWITTPGFARAVEQVLGDGIREYIWAGAAMRFPHGRVARTVGGRRLDEGVKWIVD